MPIPVLCPGCNARLNAPDAAAGRNVKCPKCQTLMTIPTPQAAGNDFDIVDEPAPRKQPPPPRKSGPVAAPTKRPAPMKSDIVIDDDEDDRPRKRRRDDDDDDDDRPRKKKRKKKASGPPPGLLIGGGIAAVLLLAGVAFAVYWFAIRDKSKETVAAGTSDGGTKASAPTGWVQFKPVNGGFQVYLPSKPFNENTLAPRKPVSATVPRATEYSGRAADVKESYIVVAVAFPDDMSAADKDKYFEDSFKREMELPQEFIKEVSRSDVTLGGQKAKELVFEVEVAKGLAASGKGRPMGPNAEAIPDKAIVVMRTMINGNRGYILLSVALSGGHASNEKAFFDNFEIVPETATSPDTTTNPPPKVNPTPKPKGNTAPKI